MIGGFRKTSKRVNIRKKVATDDSDEDEGGIEQTPAPTLAIEKPPKPIKKSGSALSFGDELEGEDQFVLKRSKASINMSEQTKKEKKLKKKKEKEKNKQNETKNIEPVENLVSSDNGFVIKTFEDDEAIDTYDVNMTETAHKFSLKEKFSKSDIPDAATIYAMKKQREQARQFGGQVNYVPLNSNTYEGRFQTASKSRLVREEMDDSSDDERLEMKGSAKESHPALERRKQVAQALEEAQEEDDEEAKRQVDFDEFQRWEDEQIKKGSKMPTNQSETYGPRLPDANVSGPMIYNYPSQVSAYAPQIYAAPQAVPVAQTEIVTADVICGRLIECLETKKKLFELHTLEKEKTAFNLDLSNQNIKDLKRKNEDIADRFTFYQDIRGFVKDLVECLNEKVQQINSLEASMHQALQKNAQKLLTRRQNDVKDEVDEIAGKPNTESDRITNIKSRRIAEREARRARRREKRRTEASVKDHYEGMSSDDEMIPSDALRFQADKDKITKEVDTVFADVVNEFSSLDEIRTRFEQWKYGFSDSYKEAYLGLCLPKLFTPFIKLELLNWNPLELYDGQDFEDMNWYRTLVQYGDHGGQVTAEDEDTKLLPNIIEKVLIPKLAVLMKDVWDPMSSKQTKLAAFLFQRLADDYPTITSESKHTKVVWKWPMA